MATQADPAEQSVTSKRSMFEKSEQQYDAAKRPPAPRYFTISTPFLFADYYPNCYLLVSRTTSIRRITNPENIAPERPEKRTPPPTHRRSPSTANKLEPFVDTPESLSPRGEGSLSPHAAISSPTESVIVPVGTERRTSHPRLASSSHGSLLTQPSLGKVGARAVSSASALPPDPDVVDIAVPAGYVLVRDVSMVLAPSQLTFYVSQAKAFLPHRHSPY